MSHYFYGVKKTNKTSASTSNNYHPYKLCANGWLEFDGRHFFRKKKKKKKTHMIRQVGV